MKQGTPSQISIMINKKYLLSHLLKIIKDDGTKKNILKMTVKCIFFNVNLNTFTNISLE